MQVHSQKLVNFSSFHPEISGVFSHTHGYLFVFILTPRYYNCTNVSFVLCETNIIISHA